jgi:hypothetical protein
VLVVLGVEVAGGSSRRSSLERLRARAAGVEEWAAGAIPENALQKDYWWDWARFQWAGR